MPDFSSTEQVKCYHCGEDCGDLELSFDHKVFCCQGCKLVYEVLSENELTDYYELEFQPGISQKSSNKHAYRFDYLDDIETVSALLSFQNENEAHISFYIPSIHCASCIWLLENLYQLNSGVISSRVDFIKKKVYIKYLKEKLSLKSLVTLLDTIGYEPEISLASTDEKKAVTLDKRTVQHLAVAGFCFGNMMLFSVPEYFSEAELIAESFRGVFSYLNILLAIPVVFFSARDYYRSAWNSLSQKKINMDVPIVLGIISLFLYSLWEIIVNARAGYMDSLGGLLFFLLLGKIFQQKTFATLEFDRDFKAYFPIAVTRIKSDQEEVVPLSKVVVGDVILVRDEELIPADSILLSQEASIDYSFVTGEEIPVPKNKSQLIYAGGRQKGEPIMLHIQKPPSQGYLTDLWNNEAFNSSKERLLEPLSTKVSAAFTWTVLVVAFGALVFWSFSDIALGVKAFVSVLIIACPCALAMSTPFTLGNALRIFGRNKFYLKNASVVERMALLDTVVFDKTGTLTDPANASVNYTGEKLSEESLSLIKAMVAFSTHPLSNRINYWLKHVPLATLEKIEEIKGKGLQASYKGAIVKLGSGIFAGPESLPTSDEGNQVYLQMDGSYIGCFHIKSGLRKSAPAVVSELSNKYAIHVLSGDHKQEQQALTKILGAADITYNFQQSPLDKLNYLKNLNSSNKHSAMIGDGLNDAGALQASEVGIAISDRVSHFSPASDGILDAAAFSKLPAFMDFAKQCRKIIKSSFLLSFIYNLIGISLAVQGLLSPVICAVLMPLSSISVVVFTTFSTNLVALNKGLFKPNQV
ncbi:heavy metal translocating P-type ATPase metal-binding domain-containing protein [Algoriphagus halophytocola]|uniref:Heavy metal translocating P-type ATPase metal-binding domain-containing protein n=1 Tax=Algoriphagus halophytocola TaxID=2991499 RepID=A0ABY6MK17_9BACT|nr:MULTISPECIES: heavy metal translocating P-type ATPase metal-binding domain-containing protein [unclassified Algoriphagus]UZD22539.1 heavy metal translocating P-type ATPase metal-binding domain-containing protein [Algoriphagus sp. TR-M5]WBL43802.1 heavy metal translocating P-type ATPase metal-binding domain-containing protein [Algoriphagus sp. TR-M9]